MIDFCGGDDFHIAQGIKQIVIFITDYFSFSWNARILLFQ